MPLLLPRARLVAVPVTVLTLSAALLGQVPPPPENAPTTPALKRLLDQREVTAVLNGFRYAEGPFWHPDGFLIFADSPLNRLHRYDPASRLRIFREPSGIATAVALDAQGRLLATEHQSRRISRTEKDGTITTLVDRYQGKRLNSPNDLVVAKSGAVYFTDPPYGLPRQTEGKELDFQGVYRYDPNGALTLLVRDLVRPNGIALSPDEKQLYVTDTERAQLHAFTLDAAGAVTGDRVIAELRPWKSGVMGLADGLAVDADGRLFVTGPGGVWVLDRNGGRLGVIPTPESPSACAFGDEDGKTLYITARTRLYRIRLKVSGVRWRK